MSHDLHPSRRQFLKTGAAALAAQTARAADVKPNIILIVADDLGYGDLGCYGQQQIQTPHLDRMAREGTRFTQAYAGSTVCAPSRCCLMTGKHTGHATVRGNVKPESGLREDEVTIAEILKKAGYRTALFGKWGLGGPGTGSIPNRRGFDQFFGYLDQQHAHNSYPEHLWSNQDEVLLTENWFDRKRVFSNDLFTQKALQLVQSTSEPFFLALTYTAPHADNERGAATGNGMETPDDQPYHDRSWPAVEKNFASLVTRMDADVGRLLEALRARGMDERTLVLFTSDNGPHREGGHNPDYFHSRGPLRGIKRDLYEGGIRVPMIARWPGTVPAGKTSDQVMAFWDLLPTFAELAGASAPSGLDGISMRAALKGERQSRQHDLLYWEFHENRFAQAIRIGEYKCVRVNPGQPIEVYRLTDDLGESRNIAATQPAEVKQAERLFREARVPSQRFAVPAVDGARSNDVRKPPARPADE